MHCSRLWNPLAVVAYAKGAAAYMGLAQELYFMGGVDAGDQSLKMFANRTANWLQSRVDFHTDDTVSLQTVLDASNAMENPIINWRFSCRSNDAANITSMVGCADAVANWTVSTQVCSLYDGGNGLCMCKCETDAQASACGNGMMANENSKTFPLMRTSAMDQGMVAAKVLSERNRQLFKEGDVYNLITALKLMSRCGAVARRCVIHQTSSQAKPAHARGRARQVSDVHPQTGLLSVVGDPHGAGILGQSRHGKAGATLCAQGCALMCDDCNCVDDHNFDKLCYLMQRESV